MKWKIVTIKSISKQIRGVSYTPKDVSSVPLEGHIRLLRANNITESGIDLSDTVFVNQKCISESQKLKVGDILIAASSGSVKIVGKAILIEDEINSSFGAFCKVIRPSENVDYRYLSYYFRSSDYRQKISHLAAGANINNLRNEDLDNLEIPLPPLPTQKRIAEILDAADALRRKDQELLRKYDELAQAIFIDMFGDPVKNEKGWDRIPFAELFDSRLGKMLDAKKQVGGKKFKYLGNSNLQWFRFNLDNLSEMEFADNEIEKFELKKGDILICEGGEVGRCAIWNNDMPNVYFQKAIHRARAISNNITPEYTVMLFWFLAKYGGLNDYVTAATIAHLTGEKLKLIPIPVPPIDLQIKYRDVVLQLNKQKELFAVSQLHSENMFNSLLQQAFKGELVK